METSLNKGHQSSSTSGNTERKTVSFTNLPPSIFQYEPYYDLQDLNSWEDDLGDASVFANSLVTEDILLLSTHHGCARRELRDISKFDLQTAIKYGVKSPAKTIRGETRWKFEFGNITYITDETCTKEVTSYKNPVHIEKATITDAMIIQHNEVMKILETQPELCTTHSIIIIDQSGSMNKCDVDGFKTRSDASYSTLALNYIAEQLYERQDEAMIDVVTIIEMRDEGSIFLEKHPLNWILFNKILGRQKTAKPSSHGNYSKSLQVAAALIMKELSLLQLDLNDLPAFYIVLLSDGKPSDEANHISKEQRLSIIITLSMYLKSKLTMIGIGVGAMDNDFQEISTLVDIVKMIGSKNSHFIHAGLSAQTICKTFSSLATSLTTTRTKLLESNNNKPKVEKQYVMSEKGIKYAPTHIYSFDVTRHFYDHRNIGCRYPWRQVNMINKRATGFEITQQPFARGAERLA